MSFLKQYLSSRQRYRILAVAGLALSHTATAFAADTTWFNGTGNRLWTDPGNWTNGVPTAVDRAFSLNNIDLGGVDRTVAEFTVSGNRGPIFNGVPHTSAINASSSSSGTLSAGSTVAAAQDGSNILLEMGGLPFGRFGMNGVFGDGAGGGDFGLLGAGRLGGPNTYTGITSGRYLFHGDGSSRNSALFDLQIGRILILNDVPNSDRLNDQGVVQMRVGTLELGGGGAVSIVESVGTLMTIASTNSIILNPNGSGTLALISAALDRRIGSSIQSTANTAAGSRLRFINAPPMVGGVSGGDATQRPVVLGAFARPRTLSSSRPTTRARIRPTPLTTSDCARWRRARSTCSI